MRNRETLNTNECSHSEGPDGTFLRAELHQAKKNWRTFAAGTRTHDASNLRVGSFEDIGVSQQAAWYEVATSNPLIHKKSGTHVLLHSVNRFHAASIESAQALCALARPSVLAVQLPNGEPWGPAQVVRERLAVARSSSEVRRIADGYHRVCLGIGEVSSLNPTRDALLQSYVEGRRLCRLQGLLDIDNGLDDAVAEQPERAQEVAKLRAEQSATLMQRDVWYSMFLSGMLPLEHFDRPMLQAYDQGKIVEFVDLPMSALADFARAILPDDKDAAQILDAKEHAAFTDIMTAYGTDMLPLGLPEEVTDLMAPCVMYPGQIDVVLALLEKHASITLDLAKYKAAYVVRALCALVEQPSSSPQASKNDHIVCLVDRLQEPIIRSQWEAIMEEDDAGKLENFVPDSMHLKVVQPQMRGRLRRRNC